MPSGTVAWGGASTASARRPQTDVPVHAKVPLSTSRRIAAGVWAPLDGSRGVRFIRFTHQSAVALQKRALI